LPEAGSTHVRRLLYIRSQFEEEVGVVKHVRVWLIVWTVLEVDVFNELRVRGMMISSKSITTV